MNVLFLTLSDFSSLDFVGIYPDLLNEFVRLGHNVYVVSPREKRKKVDTHVIEDGNTHILKLKIGNITKTNLLQKGISTLTIEDKFKAGIKKYYSDVKFDLILYSTPPITLYRAIKYIKKRDSATTYLMLKDIFPQNALDIGMLKTTGIKGLIYRFFREKEKRLYRLSDYIGCMSPANVKYLLEHNKYIAANRVCLCPNALKARNPVSEEAGKIQIRKEYGLPEDKLIFVFGGNLGKPQGIDFLIECLNAVKKRKDAFFLIVGSGTEFGKISEFCSKPDALNIKLIKELPADEFDRMLTCCDVGMLFLDSRFTIPNFPSRILSYMQARLPILSVTDKASDIGPITCENGFGFWCESNDYHNFVCEVDKIIAQRDCLPEMGKLSKRYLEREYNPVKICADILDTIKNDR